MCVLVFVGLKWVLSCPLWFEIAFSAKNQKFTATYLSRLRTFRFRFAVSPTSMSILLVRCLALQVFRICSLLLTERLAGRKRFLCLPPPSPTAQRPSSMGGFSVTAFRILSQATEVPSSPPRCGPACAASSPSNTLRQPPTTRNPTASWSGSTAVSRMLSEPGQPEQTGTHMSLGYC